MAGLTGSASFCGARENLSGQRRPADRLLGEDRSGIAQSQTQPRNHRARVEEVTFIAIVISSLPSLVVKSMPTALQRWRVLVGIC
jgi:hypothetical protein